MAFQQIIHVMKFLQVQWEFYIETCFYVAYINRNT